MGLLKDVIATGSHADRPAASSEGRLYYETDTDTLFRDNGTSWDTLTLSGGGGGAGLYTDYLCYQEQQSSGTAGGTFTSGAWQTRVLNTEVADTGGLGSLASNQITLAAGTYRVQASAPAFQANRHQLRLQNISDSTTLVVGQSAYANDGATADTNAFLAGRFTLSSSKIIELQHRCDTTAASQGFGIADFFGTEVYAVLELWKEA